MKSLLTVFIVVLALMILLPSLFSTAQTLGPASNPTIVVKTEASLQPVVDSKEETVVIVPGEPMTPGQVVTAAKNGIEFAKARNWLGCSSVAIFILIWFLKAAGLFKRLKKRWIYIIVPGLGVAAMVLAAIAGDMSFNAAWIVLASAPCAALLSDFVKRGILNQEYETLMTTKPGDKKDGPFVPFVNGAVATKPDEPMKEQQSSTSIDK